MRWNSRMGITKKVERVLGLHSESVIQTSISRLAARLSFSLFYAEHVGLWPQWICPIGRNRIRGASRSIR